MLKKLLYALVSLLAGFSGFCQEISLNNIVVVVGDPHAMPVKFAAKELAFHLEKITGAKIAVSDLIPDNGNAIVLGACPQSEKAGIKVNDIPRDGYVIKTVNNTIYIVGKDSLGDKGDIESKLAMIEKSGVSGQKTLMGQANWDFERGTLYGTYRFLETLGVRWLFPGDKGTFVPRLENLSVKPVNLSESPIFEFRQIGSWNTSPLRYYNKKGYVGVDSNNEEEFKDLDFTQVNNLIWVMRQRTSTIVLPMQHMPPRLGWKERFGASHLEYFALLENGKRDVNAQKADYREHLCNTNPEIPKIVAGDVQAYLQGKSPGDVGIPTRYSERNIYTNGWPPDVFYGNIVAITPNDSFRSCHCEECKKLQSDPALPYGAKDSKQAWNYAVNCAKAIAKIAPDVKVATLAYSSYCIPPENMDKLPSNMIIGLCPAFINRPFNLTAPEKYQELIALFQKWQKLSSNPLAFWFHYLYRYNRPHHYGVPMYLPHLTGQLWKDFAKYGKWVYIEQDGDSLLFEQLNRYLMMRLSYEPGQNVDDLLNDYFLTSYGPAAPVMKKIFDDIEKRCTELTQKDAGQMTIWDEYFAGSVLDRYAKETEEALKLAGNTQYGEQVKLFDKYYLGLMRDGYNKYVKNVKEVLNSNGASVSIASVTDPIVVDGNLDEASWTKENAHNKLKMRNNVDGKGTAWPTEVKLLRSPDKLYFAFTCHDPETMKRSENEGSTDTIEIFMDPAHSHDTYYHIQIDMAGRITDTSYEGGGEPGQETWNSKAEVAIKKHEDRWVVEIAVPRSSFNNGLKDPTNRPWGANFCRAILNPPVPKDRFSCWSPLLVGSFKQPDMFGHMYFQH